MAVVVLELVALVVLLVVMVVVVVVVLVVVVVVVVVVISKRFVLNRKRNAGVNGSEEPGMTYVDSVV